MINYTMLSKNKSIFQLYDNTKEIENKTKILNLIFT
jgi:hypothetical protein